MRVEDIGEIQMKERDEIEAIQCSGQVCVGVCKGIRERCKRSVRERERVKTASDVEREVALNESATERGRVEGGEEKRESESGKEATMTSGL